MWTADLCLRRTGRAPRVIHSCHLHIYSAGAADANAVADSCMRYSWEALAAYNCRRAPAVIASIWNGPGLEKEMHKFKIIK